MNSTRGSVVPTAVIFDLGRGGRFGNRPGPTFGERALRAARRSTKRGSVGAGISWGSSSTTVYRGTLGSLSADSFAENFYSAGLFTYIHNAGDPTRPQFEVINYWVKR